MREFMVTSLRLVASSGGNVLPANWWGKIKTVTQISFIIFVLFFSIFFKETQFIYFEIFAYITAVFTIISGVQYLWVNRHLVNHTK